MIGNKNELITWLLTQNEKTLFEIKEHKEKNTDNFGNYTPIR